MADSKLQRVLTLKLNQQWMPIGQTPIEKLMVDLSTGVVCGIDIDYELNDDGTPNFDTVNSMNAIGSPDPLDPSKSWDEWVKLPVRPWETAIHTKTLEIRVPFIVVCSAYNKIPNKQVLFPSKTNVWNRDDHVCQYTGMTLNRDLRSIDHIHPVAKGGQNEWHNLVTCHRGLNSWKSDTLLQDCFLTNVEFATDPPLEAWRQKQVAAGKIGLELLKIPTPPRPRVGTVFTKTREEWGFFMFN